MTMTVHGRVFVAGRWETARGAEVIPVVNPTSEETIAVVHGASEADIDGACCSAAQGLAAWSELPIAERARAMLRLAAAIEAHAERIAELITEEIGTPIAESRSLQVGLAVQAFRRTAEIGAQMNAVEMIGSTKVFRVPVGVVACITPWNYPLFQIACKVSAALVAGCTVVLKPSEIAPGSAMMLTELMREVRVPDGVFNMVNGSGPVVGERLIRHPLVDAVSFTGSTGAGERIGAVAGAALKRVTLELGGKSPSVMLPGADVAQAVERTIAKCFQNTGQTCAALTRLIVPVREQDQIADYAVRVARGYRVGDPRSDTTRLGPVATLSQRNRVRSLLDGAAAEGARLLTGGSEPPSGMTRGFFVQPSVYIAEPQMKIARQEIFGPVLTLLPYAHEEEALRLAAGGDVGLSAAVWSRDPAAAQRFATRIRAGSISINGAPTHPDAPFGGFRRSGFGRERGRHGIDEFLTTQAIHL